MGDVPDATREPTPFYVAPGGDSSRPRLLLVSDQFPPGQSAGALRWQKLAPFLAERGWELDVITLDPSELRAADAGRLAELPPGTRVYGLRRQTVWETRADRGVHALLERARRLVRRSRAPAREPASAPSNGARPRQAAARPTTLSPEEIRFDWRERRSYVRAWVSWVDYRSQGAWARLAARLGVRLVRAHAHRAVVSCGPWHMSVHEAGRRISARTGVPFVMDMRDPWSLPRRFSEPGASPLWFALARHYERLAVTRARLVVTNAEPVREAMAAAYRDTGTRIITITNGFDEEATPPSRHGGRFVVAYAGGIYLDRDPRLLFRAAQRVIAELRLAPEQFGIELIGNVDDYGGVPMAEMARQEGIAAHVRTGPARPRREALEFLAGATMLVSLPQDSPWAIPSKIFEYMQFDAWMLVLADVGSPSELLLRGSGADVVAPHDVDAMTAVLRARYLAFARGERPVRLSRDARFGRRHQATLLLDAIGECIGGDAGGARASVGAAAAGPAADVPRFEPRAHAAR